jgi:hypothetical protein
MSQATGKEKEKKLNRSKSSSELSNKVSKSDPENKLSPVSPKKSSSRSRVGSVDEHNKSIKVNDYCMKLTL